jgi:GntR family transcriptional repressor for pyruvate dehydrogenase complex
MINKRPMKSSEWVMGELKREIETGERQPGDKLPSVVELSERFGVGRSTIREALSALKAMGWLDIRQGGGTFVKAPGLAAPADSALAEWMANAQSLLQLIEVRRVLETGIAALAARNRTEADAAALGEIVRRMERVIADERAGEQADTEFHLLLAESTHNPLLIELIRSLSDKLQSSMRDTRALWFYGDRRSAEALLQEHASIAEAVAARNERLAAERMDHHLAKVESVLRTQLINNNSRA